ncbi:hypothetical protein PUN28_014048 [Cardiocondyla obscurior]|uniref:Uncharacterized protein n=1 Tax=Cardiocondyla obscurior TaxID=286306 RepID=A0AAW2F6X0_9HYME
MASSKFQTYLTQYFRGEDASSMRIESAWLMKGRMHDEVTTTLGIARAVHSQDPHRFAHIADSEGEKITSGGIPASRRSKNREESLECKD